MSKVGGAETPRSRWSNHRFSNGQASPLSADWTLLPESQHQDGLSSTANETYLHPPKPRGKTRPKPKFSSKPKGEFDDMVLHVAREDNLWRKEIICVKDICDHKHQPRWDILLRTFSRPGDWDTYRINCPFDTYSDAIFLENRVIVTGERHLRAALRYFKNEGRLNVKGYIVAKGKIADDDYFRWVDDI